MKKISKEILEKAEEAAKQYERAEIFWNCSNLSDEEIEHRRQRFLIGYEDALKPLTEALFPKQIGEKKKKEAETYLQKKGLALVVDLYQKRREAEETYRSIEKGAEREQKKKEKEQQESMLDPSITETQRKGLQKFHQWMYRNCDRKGMKYFGEKLFGSDGSARNFVDKFMSQPASVQLKALYLLENNKRKEKDENGIFNQASQINYVPDLDRLKDKMTATKWKIWKRTNGSYLYWNKLNEALEAAQTDEKILLEFRQEANKIVVEHPDDYRTRPEFATALNKLKISNMEDLEKTGTFDKVLEVTDSLGGKNDDVDMIQMVAMNLETGIQQAKNGFKVSNNKPDGYMGRIVSRMAGETAADYYNRISSIGFSTFSAVSGVLSIYAGIKELKEGSMVQKTIGQVAGSLDVGTTGMYVTETVSDMTGSIGECLKASQKFVDMAGNVGTSLFGVANLLSAAKGVVDITSGVKGKSHAEQAEKLGDDIQDETIQNRAKFAKYLNQKERNRGIRGFIQGSMGVTSATIALAASSVPIAGQAAGIVSISMGLYESYVQQNKNLQKKYRRGIDTELFHGGKDLETLDQEYKKKLENRLKNMKSNSLARKKAEELYKNQEKRYDILRKEMAVKNNSVFLRDCYEKVVAGMGEEAYRNVFYIDPNKKGTFDNLITKENYKEYFTLKEELDGDSAEEKKQKQEHNKQVKVRMSYKELMESFGTKVEFSSAKTSGKNKQEAKQIKEQMAKNEEEKRQKVADAFTKK